MNIVELKKEKEQLEQQREQAIAQVNQIAGAIAMLEKLIAENDGDSNDETVSEKVIEEVQELAEAA